MAAYQTNEYRNGQLVREVAPFREYGSPAESSRDWWNLMQAKRYAPVRASTGFEDAARAVAGAGYATDPAYAQKLLKMEARNDEQQNFIDQRKRELAAIGVPPHLAELGSRQAALESAWGRSAPGGNFYGIKGAADARTGRDMDYTQMPDTTIPGPFGGGQMPSLGPQPLMGGPAMPSLPQDAATAAPAAQAPLTQIGLGILAAPGYGGNWLRSAATGMQQGMLAHQQRQKFEMEMEAAKEKKAAKEEMKKVAASLPEPFRSVVLADPSSYGNVLQQVLAMRKQTSPQGKDRYMEVGGRIFDTTTQQYVQPGAMGGAAGDQTMAKLPLSQLPYYQDLAKEFDLGDFDAESVRMAAATGDPGHLVRTLKPEQQLTQAERYTKQIEPYRAAAQAAESIQSLIGKQGPFRDVASVYSLVKFLDPTSVVREGEVALMSSAMPLFDRLQTTLNKIGEGGLIGDKTRQDVEATMRELMKLYQKNSDALVGDVSAQARRFRIDPEVWTGRPIAWPTWSTAPGPVGAPPPITPATQQLEAEAEEVFR